MESVEPHVAKVPVMDRTVPLGVNTLARGRELCRATEKGPLVICYL